LFAFAFLELAGGDGGVFEAECWGKVLRDMYATVLIGNGF
jgi:hypothetical protein